jgi:eukaryotic-like serine/threonine-protein kinase
MEFVRGLTLSELLREGALEVGRAVAISEGIADALAAAHRKGLVHRDVRPGPGGGD